MPQQQGGADGNRAEKHPWEPGSDPRLTGEPPAVAAPVPELSPQPCLVSPQQRAAAGWSKGRLLLREQPHGKAQPLPAPLSVLSSIPMPAARGQASNSPSFPVALLRLRVLEPVPPAPSVAACWALVLLGPPHGHSGHEWRHQTRARGAGAFAPHPRWLFRVLQPFRGPKRSRILGASSVGLPSACSTCIQLRLSMRKTSLGLGSGGEQWVCSQPHCHQTSARRPPAAGICTRGHPGCHHRSGQLPNFALLPGSVSLQGRCPTSQGDSAPTGGRAGTGTATASQPSTRSRFAGEAAPLAP